MYSESDSCVIIICLIDRKGFLLIKLLIKYKFLKRELRITKLH